MIKFTYENTEYGVDLEQITFDQAIELSNEIGLTLGMFLNSLNSGGDARAVKALLWLGKNQAGEACRLKDLGGMSPFKVLMVPEPAADESTSEARDATEDPTSRGGKTRSRRTSATS